MRRRDLLRLAGTAGLAAVTARRAAAQDVRAGWRFSLDADSRWSLADERGMVISGASVALELAGADPVPLGALEGVRRMRGGNRREGTWTVVGHTGSVQLTAEFADGPAPTIEVRVRGLDEPRDLLAVRFSEGAQAPGRFAWLNGYGSGSPCAVAPIGTTTRLVSHWLTAFLGQAELAMQFGVADGGAGEFVLEDRALSAVCRFPRRTLGAEHSPVTCALTIVPGRNALDALGSMLAGVAGPGRRPGATPGGWRSRRALVAAAREEDVLAQLEAIGRVFDAGSLGVVQLDDGYQRSPGDWETSAAFPHGHRWLTDRVHAFGLEASLWMAPFLVGDASGVPAEHPGWLLSGSDGRPLAVDAGSSSSPVYVLDGSQRPVQDWLRALARRAVGEWGYDRLTLELPPEAARDARADRGASPYEAQRAGLRALREGAGRAFVTAGGAPLQHAVGMADAVRVCSRATSAWHDVVLAARGVLLRSHLGGRAWLPDADAILAGSPFTAEEARAWVSVCALTGSMAMIDDDVAGLPPERLEILRRALPTLPARGRPADLTSEPVTLGQVPAWVLAQPRGDWWTLAAVNWDDQPTRLEADVADLGLRGPLAAYDVWSERRLPDVQRRLVLDLPTHGCVVLGLRRPRPGPFVVGTTRHIVQGALDLDAERWDPRRRVLSGRSVQLDRRPYALTIQVPPGFHPRRCSGSAACTVVHPHADDARTVRLEFPAPLPEVEWEVGF